MNQKELNTILEKHKKWLNDETDGERANLICANLTRANLYGANLDETTINFPITCPDTGAFVGWKKANGKIVKLQILEDSRRSSATSRKCRCDKALVLSIEEEDGTKSKNESVHSNYNSDFLYRVGEIVEAKDFDANRWNECAPGIHFFITRHEAVDYNS